MIVRNLTPHPIHIYQDGTRLTLPPEQPTPRVTEISRPIEPVTIHGHPVTRFTVTTSTVTGLPQPAADTLLVVARVVAHSAADRPDLVVPYDPVRAADGAIIGCRAFAHINQPIPAGRAR